MAKEDMIKDWLEGKISADELQKRKHEAGSEEEFEDLKKVIDEAAKLKVPEKKTKEQAWDQFLTKIDTDEEEVKPAAKVRKLNPFIPVGIAAAIALLVSIYFIFMAPVTVMTGKGEQLTYELPDGSEVMLNADSKITFSKFLWSDDRSLSLQGEAFFEVKKGDSPFIVNGDLGAVKVTGTSFNAYFRNKLAVHCYTGTVIVNDLNNKTVELNSGEMVVAIQEGLSEPKTFNNSESAAWREGEFYFEKAELTEVLAELERQYDVEVIYDGNGSRAYTGYFTNKNLDEALQLIFKPMSLTYRKENNKIIVE